MSLTLTIEVPLSFPHPCRGNDHELRSDADAASLPLGLKTLAGELLGRNGEEQSA